MGSTRVVNIRVEACDVYIGRKGQGYDGYFGNPIRTWETCPMCGDIHFEKGSTIECFRTYFNERLKKDSIYRQRVESLHDKRLGCFCAPEACHGDVYVEWLNANRTE